MQETSRGFGNGAVAVSHTDDQLHFVEPTQKRIQGCQAILYNVTAY